ncbi:hypothetical protein [Microbacterium deminutum]|uniref:Uncharacterized protein n=1 Tax=Microbacterium deminutum TaxID=344164 RepID=A0ABN2Q2P9_9MICO
MPGPILTEVQRLASTGARAVAPFVLGDTRWVAVPQLAVDSPGSPPGINGGSSDAEVLLFRDGPHGFALAGSLPVGGGEDVEVFRIDRRVFAAVASIRTGSGPYDYATVSPIFEYVESGFRLFQELNTYAAKQLRHFRIGRTHYLGIAQNLPPETRPSAILRWDGSRFAPFQELESIAGYGIEVFEISGTVFLAHADHLTPSRLYRFDGERFVEHQELVSTGGRAFLLLTEGRDVHLAVGRIDSHSVLLRWQDGRFSSPIPIPGGPGGRAFARLVTDRAVYVVRVDFIHGSPADPQPDLRSHVYRFKGGELREVAGFRTSGGTDVAVLPGGGREFAVSNGLAAAPVPGRTFAADTVIYRLDDDVREEAG